MAKNLTGPATSEDHTDMNDTAEARAALEKLVVDFTEAFNRDDLEAVMACFAEDAVYDEFNDIRHVGKDAIRKAFEPQFAGRFGKMRFHTEDMFLDVAAGKALIRWVLTLEEAHQQGAYRGLDILHFEKGKLLEKHTYCKAKVPLIHKKAALEAAGRWPRSGTPGSP